MLTKNVTPTYPYSHLLTPAHTTTQLSRPDVKGVATQCEKMGMGGGCVSVALPAREGGPGRPANYRFAGAVAAG